MKGETVRLFFFVFKLIFHSYKARRLAGIQLKKDSDGF